MISEVPPLDVGCRLTVAIPARNEQDTIVDTLRALARQDESRTFDVLVYANNCDDRTVERVLAFKREFPHVRLHLIEGVVPAAFAHVGYARKALMDCAAQRFLAAGMRLGVIATTDADTIVAPDWVASTLGEMQFVDAVAGHVEISAADQQAMTAPLRALYAREREYRRICTELESLLDPRTEDPSPRHGAFVAASFAVTADMYVRAGRLPPVATLEDREFLFALRRVDAKIRFSLAVRAWTSGRRRARVQGGFATFIDHLASCASSGSPYLVEHPSKLVDDLEQRAAARRTNLCGAAHERLSAKTAVNGQVYPMVPIDEAIFALRAVAASRKAAVATRNNAASGAG